MFDARKRFILGVVFFSCMIIIWMTGITKYLTIEEIHHHADFLRSMIQRHYGPSVLIYTAVYIMAALFALPIASLLTLVAGFLFGTIGFVYTIIASTIGALFSFLIMRYLMAEYVQQRYARQLKSFNTEMQKHGYRYLFMVRLIPVIPFFIVNIIASCLPVSIKAFLISTAIGIMPITALYTYAGQELATIHSVHDVFTGRVIIVLLGLVVIGLIPVVIACCKRRQNASNSSR